MGGDSLYEMDAFDDRDNDEDLSFPPNSKADSRKSNKPIMEKRRRARINNCLNELKGILLEAMQKDPARHSKLEKADILELTVRHLQNVQRRQLANAMATDPTVLFRFKNGFSECASEVSRYLSKLDGVEDGMKGRVTNHLTSCVNGLQQVNQTPAQPVGVGYVPSFIPYTPPHHHPHPHVIPPSNLTPPGDLNNNKEQALVIHRPTPVNPLTAYSTITTVRIPSPSPDLAPGPVDYSRRQVQVQVKTERPDPEPITPVSKESPWRPW